MKTRTSEPEEIPQVEGYTTEKRTISMLAANIWAIGVLLAFMAIGWLLIISIHDPVDYRNMLILILAILLAIVVHELIHGITWMAVTHSSFKHLSFGLLQGGVYCHIDVPMKKRAYVVGALMPLMLLGVLPFIVSLFSGSVALMFFGATMIGAAMGDVLIVWAIRKESPDTMVYDHPTEPGCVLYHPSE